MFKKLIGIYKGEYKFKYNKADLKGATKDKGYIGLLIILFVIFFCAGVWTSAQYYSIKVNGMIQNITNSLSVQCGMSLKNNCSHYKPGEEPLVCVLITGGG